MKSGVSRYAAVAAVTALAWLLPQVSVAQTSDNGAATTKAQRKEARKVAHAKRNAELKKLEAAGYNPARNDDVSYPGDIQRAERKAAQSQ
jgi:predicted secreted acid phosphatase